MPAHDICVFCAGRARLSSQIGRAVVLQKRGFRPAPARPQQQNENQAWDDKSPSYRFQPPSTAGQTLEEKLKAHSARQQHKGQQRQGQGTGSQGENATADDAAGGQHRRRSNPRSLAVKQRLEKTRTVKEPEQISFPSFGAAAQAQPPAAFPDVGAAAQPASGSWDSNDSWDAGNSASALPQDLLDKISQQNAQARQQQEATKPSLEQDEDKRSRHRRLKAERTADSKKLRGERSAKHAALMAEHQDLKRKGLEFKELRRKELADAIGATATGVWEADRVSTKVEDQRRSEIMRRMKEMQESKSRKDTTESTSGEWPRRFRTSGAPAKSSGLLSRHKNNTKQEPDALSELERQPGDGTGRQNRFKNLRSLGNFASSTTADNLPEARPPPRKFDDEDSPAYHKRDRQDERRDKLKKFATPREDEEGETTPRRGRRDFDMEEDDLPARRKNDRRSARSSRDDEDEDRPSRGRRQDRDFDEEALDDLAGLRKIREKRQREREAKKQRASAEERRKAAIAAKRSTALTKIVLPQFINVSRLAQALGVKLDIFTKKMEELGFTQTAHDHVLSAENASLIALEFDFDPTIGTELEVNSRDIFPRPAPEDLSSLPARPPIVTIMGHVDHGKTTILDYLRKSSVAASEHGGITQHIGAFSVRMSGGKLVTFLDTPGHAAFLSMRRRGANVTDIVILVVAADDSVKPQTLEALKHAREANVPIIVAVNKVDKPEADVQRVKQDLARHGVEIEDFGGDVQVVPVSGKTGKGMDDLEEAVVTLGEILDNRAEDDGLVEGWVLEATTKAAGRVATVLVRKGTLKQGSIIVAGQTWARVRTLQNEAGVNIDAAGPGTPIEVDGWRDQPAAGDMVLETETEQKATDVVDYRVEVARRQKLAEDVDAINEARRLEQEKRDREKAESDAAEEGSKSRDKAASTEGSSFSHIEVPFIIKADVSGSAEAVEGYLQQLVNPVCSPKILRAGVGPVSEFDVEHASAARGHVITFNLASPPDNIAGMALQNKVKIVEQNVIYRLLEQVKAILEEKLEPTSIQRVTGEAEVLKPFEIGVGGRKKLRIAGSRVQNGLIKRNARARVLRDGKKIYDGTINSLKNVKKDVTEMRKGTECGIGFEDWTDAQEGDQIQTYEEILEKRSLPI